MTIRLAEGLIREVLLKGKARYSRPPWTN